MNKLSILLLFVLSLLSPSANAQLDKQYQQQIQKQQEQERSNKIREAKCKKLWDLAQYVDVKDGISAGGQGYYNYIDAYDRMNAANKRYYIDVNKQIFKLYKSEDICNTNIIGSLNVEDKVLLKLEDEELVKYHEFFDISKIRVFNTTRDPYSIKRTVLGVKRR